MQSSLVFLPGKETPPAIGDEVPVELRLTTATVDSVESGLSRQNHESVREQARTRIW